MFLMLISLFPDNGVSFQKVIGRGKPSRFLMFKKRLAQRRDMSRYKFILYFT